MVSGVELFFLLLLAVCAIAICARRLRFSYPIACVLGGILLAVIPGVPAFTIPPEMILFLFLPPLLTEAAYFTSLRDFRANLRPILQLALGLVVVTAFGVGLVAHWLIPGLTLGAALVLGTIVSPPDAVAATAVIKELSVPKRLVTILEGESLVNDVTGLVLYQFAVAAVVTGMFSPAEASLQFVWMAASGLLIGWLTGRAYMHIFPGICEVPVAILSSLLVPYAAYLVAEAAHSSSVLAVVTAGLTIGWRAPLVFKPAFRLPAEAVWRMVIFVLQGIVFLLIGLKFPALLERLSAYPPVRLLAYTAAVSTACILIRFAWVYALAYGARALVPSLRRSDPYPPWRNVFIVAWVGMRGVVSLATALALPLTLADGLPFPHRDLIIFLAVSVILVTLVVQGIPLPWLLRRLTLIYEGHVLQEDWMARRRSAEAALKRLADLGDQIDGQPAALERIRSHYRDRILLLGDGPNTPLTPTEPPTPFNHPLIQTESRIWKEVLDAERNAVICLRQTFQISDDVMHDRLREIDLLHTRYDRI